MDGYDFEHMATSWVCLIFKSKQFKEWSLDANGGLYSINSKRQIKLKNLRERQNPIPHFLLIWSPGATAGPLFPESDMIRLKRFASQPNKLNDEVPTWLEEQVFSKPFAPNFSQNLKNRIVKNLWEIIFNAIQHSNSIHGITGCGQFYPKCGYFEIAFYDHGVGIPYNVRNFNTRYSNFSDCDCILWALEKGNTTRPELDTGGLGLHYLTEFLKLNGGIMQIVSHSGVYQSSGANVAPFLHIGNKFKGTLYNLRIIYDDDIYCLKGEGL